MLLGAMSYFGGMGTFGQVLLGLPMVLDLLGTLLVVLIKPIILCDDF